MRSRYVAFAIGARDVALRPACIAYLVATHHPEHRSAALEEELRGMMPITAWHGLEVLGVSESGAAAEVEFIARFEQGGARGELHERSHFVREGGHWLYTTGTIGG